MISRKVFDAYKNATENELEELSQRVRSLEYSQETVENLAKSAMKSVEAAGEIIISMQEQLAKIKDNKQ